MNEIKSCKNDTCGHYVSYCTLNCKGAVWYDSCPKYIIEKSESAWEMFRGLFIRGLSKLEWEKINNVLIKYGYSDDCILAVWLLNLCSEQEAIKIMLDIEKELKNVI